MPRTKNATLSVAAPDTLADTIGAYLSWAADGLEVEWQGKLQFNILVDEDDYGGAYKNGTIHVNLLNGHVKAVSYRKVVKKGTHRNLLDLPPAKVGDLIDEYVRAIPWSGMEAPYDTPSIQDRHPDYDAYMSGRYASVRGKSRKRASYTFSKPVVDMLVAYLNQNTGGDFYWYRRGLEFHWQIDEVVERSREEEVAGDRKGRVVVDLDKGIIEARDKNDRSVKKGRISKPLEMSPKKLERLVEDYYFHVPVIPDADQNRRWTGDPMLDMDDYPHGFDEDFDTPSIEERYPERSSYMSGRYASKKTAARFNLGQVVQTRGVAHAMRRDPAFAEEIMAAFNKYRRGDWGDTQSDSKRRNNAVLRGEEDQVFAVYNTSQGKVYIITEWDGSVTTILFANEY